MEINPLDIRVEVIGGSGWTRTPNTVQVTHLPTGITTQCSKNRSQHTNRHGALQELISILKTQTDFTKQLELQF